MGCVPWIPWRLKGVRVVQRGREACEGLYLEPAAFMDCASSWAILLMLECHGSLLIMAGSVEFHLSLKAPHVLCFCSGPLPGPRFRVSGLIPAQECNYLSSCPDPGEYKQQTWHFDFSLWQCFSGGSAPASISCRATLGVLWPATGAQAPSFSEVPVPFPGPEI